MDGASSTASFPATGAAVPAIAWPGPPWACRVPTEPAAAECILRHADGRITRGRLQLFDPEAEVAVVVPAEGGTPERFAFEAIRVLMLPEVIEVAEPAAGRVSLPRLPYKVNLAGGKALRGVALASHETPAGVFLFPVVEGRDACTRLFVPRVALESVRVGERLGEALVAQQAAEPAQIELALQQQAQVRNERLGDLLVQQHVVSAEQLEAALKLQERMPMVRVGEALVSLGLVRQEQIDAALAEQRANRGTPLGELLVKQGLISREALRAALARKMGYPVVDLQRFPIDPEAFARLPLAAAQRLRVVAFARQGAGLVVATDDVTRRAVLEEVEFIVQAKVLPALAAPEAIDAVLGLSGVRPPIDAPELGGPSTTGAATHDLPGAGQMIESLERDGADAGEAGEAGIEQSDNTLVRLINQIIVEAHQSGASDVHIECPPGREKVRIRLRKDGRLQNYLELPHTYRSALVARLKIMCDLDISERRKPQDGKINFARFSPQHRFELRVATIPTVNGLEDVVLRLLASARALSLDELSFTPDNLARLRRAIERPYGLVLCAGPTGSGKTTTLHSALAHLNTPERKIWTAEDPVEITQAGLRQIQVNPRIDWTFARALRALLRADPDVIMIGEVRDAETARTVVEASLTGHLVLSTLHTNSAPETVSRLLDMGLDPFNFADALLAVVAQRLVRRLCPQCRTAQPATDEQIDQLASDWMKSDVCSAERDTLVAGWTARHGVDGRLQWYTAPGCPHCDGSGRRGRVGIHELLTVGREQRQLIQRRASVAEIQASAMLDGMHTLRQDGIDKVLAGLVSIEDVRATSND